jgi:hypothetical protein
MSRASILDQEGGYQGEVSDVLLEPGEHQDIHAVFRADPPLHAKLSEYLQERVDVVLVHQGARYDLTLIDMLDEEFRAHGRSQEPQEAYDADV